MTFTTTLQEKDFMSDDKVKSSKKSLANSIATKADFVSFNALKFSAPPVWEAFDSSSIDAYKIVGIAQRYN